MMEINVEKVYLKRWIVGTGRSGGVWHQWRKVDGDIVKEERAENRKRKYMDRDGRMHGEGINNCKHESEIKRELWRLNVQGAQLEI